MRSARADGPTLKAKAAPGARAATMRILGIETSCDETAAAVVDSDRNIRANAVLSQLAAHAPYGGVVPEIAARTHVEHLDGLIAGAMRDAELEFDDLHGVAATAGPGLIGGVMVGLTTGKAIALARGIPLVAVNHLEAHALSARLVDDAPFPFLLLLVSGGHCQFLRVDGVGRYRRYGATLDDAPGEAFDKAARLLGLGWPGGPALERLAAGGDPARFALPRPLVGRPGCDFSFSGLKTAVRRVLETLPGGPTTRDRADLAAGFQAAVADAMEDRLRNAAARFASERGDGGRLVVAGGVAANRALRARLQAVASAVGMSFAAPPPALCTDNAAMVAWAGVERLRAGFHDGLDAPARARWPLDAEGAA